ncbi:MAG TPA: glycoside hydrolase family 18 protein [Chloroflexi bacterium]|nr:glycoside hydrolase family 18 protein [Chloroflexota bacterium]
MDKKVIAYYFAMSGQRSGCQIADLAGDKLTHVNYAFADVSDDGRALLGFPELDLGHDGNYRQLRDLKARYPHLKVLISIGGWTWSGKFSDAALTDEARNRFVSSCVAVFLEEHAGSFDGIDVDWEYPVGGGMLENVCRPEDRRNFTLLMQEFRRQLDALGAQTGQRYLLTAATPASPQHYGHFELGDVHRWMDWINVMTYDYHGPGFEKVTNFNAPLYATADDPTPGAMSTHETIHGYLRAGVPVEKLVLGVPFYGHAWGDVPDVDHGLYQPGDNLPFGTLGEGGTGYGNLARHYVNQAGYTRHWHPKAQVPWLYNPEARIFISYDDPESIGRKADYVNAHGLGGMMFWEYSSDDGALLDAIDARLI